MMRFIVTSRYQIHHLRLGEPYAVISITDPYSPPVVMPEDPLMIAMIRLEFFDLDRPYGDYRLFSIVEADTILKFTKKLAGQDIVVICQCEAGISRSAAVAAALSRIFNQMDSEYFKLFHPNRRVYSMILARHYELQDQSVREPMPSLPVAHTVIEKGSPEFTQNQVMP